MKREPQRRRKRRPGCGFHRTAVKGHRGSVQTRPSEAAPPAPVPASWESPRTEFCFPLTEGAELHFSSTWTPAVQARRAESGETARNHPWCAADSGGAEPRSAGGDEPLLCREAPLRAALLPAPSAELHCWGRRDDCRKCWSGGVFPPGCLAGCRLVAGWLQAALSLQSWSESLRDSPACYSQRGGRATSGWKHFSKVLKRTCSDWGAWYIRHLCARAEENTPITYWHNNYY